MKNNLASMMCLDLFITSQEEEDHNAIKKSNNTYKSYSSANNWF